MTVMPASAQATICAVPSSAATALTAPPAPVASWAADARMVEDCAGLVRGGLQIMAVASRATPSTRRDQPRPNVAHVLSRFSHARRASHIFDMTTRAGILAVASRVLGPMRPSSLTPTAL